MNRHTRASQVQRPVLVAGFVLALLTLGCSMSQTAQHRPSPDHITLIGEDPPVAFRYYTYIEDETGHRSRTDTTNALVFLEKKSPEFTDRFIAPWDSLRATGPMWEVEWFGSQSFLLETNLGLIMTNTDHDYPYYDLVIPSNPQVGMRWETPNGPMHVISMEPQLILGQERMVITVSSTGGAFDEAWALGLGLIRRSGLGGGGRRVYELIRVFRR